MLFDRCKLLALSISIVCGSASATVVYDTLGPTNGYNANVGWNIGGGDGDPLSAYNFVTADYITLSSSGYLTSITAALNLLPESTALPIRYDIRADNGGIPGATLASTLVPIEYTNSSPRLYIATFSGATFLNSSTPYWLTLSATYSGTTASWQQNSLGIRTTHVFTGTPWLQPGQWYTGINQLNGAARIEVLSAVPEMSEAMMLLLGAPLLLAAVRVRRRAQGPASPRASLGHYHTSLCR